MANNSESLASLNKSFLCYDASYDAGDPLPKYDQVEFADALQTEIVQRLAESGLGQFNLLRNPRFAVHHYLARIANYYAGDFIPVTKDKKFLAQLKKVWCSLISKIFFGEIWIAKDPLLLEIEREAVERRGEDWWRSCNFPDSEIRLYVRENEGRKFSFRSIWTNVKNIEIDPEKAVLATVDGLDNFIAWYQILLDYLAGHTRTINLMLVASKNFVVDVQDRSKWVKEKDHLLNSMDPFLAKENIGFSSKEMFNENEYEEFQFAPMESVMEALKQNRAFFDERAAFYGFFGKNLGQKNERVGVGESFIDFKQVNNIQQSYLLRINVIANDMKDKLGAPEDLEVRLNTNEPHVDERFSDMNKFKGGYLSNQGMNQENSKYMENE